MSKNEFDLTAGKVVCLVGIIIVIIGFFAFPLPPLLPPPIEPWVHSIPWYLNSSYIVPLLAISAGAIIMIAGWKINQNIKG
jgi:hypothetical protein